jgi:hypothetical protein
MLSTEQCLGEAFRCEQRAAKVRNAHLQQTLMNIAASWRRLATAPARPLVLLDPDEIKAELDEPEVHAAKRLHHDE